MTKVAVLGGTGAMGSGLAPQLAGGNEVRIGSRNLEKAVAAAAKMPGVKGVSDRDAAVWCEAAILTVPFDAVGNLNEFAEPLSGKLVVSAINPLKREGTLFRYVLSEKSAAELVASALPASRVATAFNNLPAAFFRSASEEGVDILVATDSKRTYEETAALVRSVPRLRPLYVGPLSQAQSVERLTVVVLNAATLRGGPDLSIRFV